MLFRSHDWRRFLRPHELARAVRAAGLQVTDISGLSYRPLKDEWYVSTDTSVNYLVACRKAA